MGGQLIHGIDLYTGKYGMSFQVFPLLRQPGHNEHNSINNILSKWRSGAQDNLAVGQQPNLRRWGHCHGQ